MNILNLSTKKYLWFYKEACWLVFVRPSAFFYKLFPRKLKLDRFPGYFDVYITYYCLSKIPNFNNREKYLNILYDALTELYLCENDEDIKKYIKKYRLRDYVFFRAHIDRDYNEETKKLKYISKKYEAFQITICKYIRYLYAISTVQTDFNDIMNNDLKLVFNKDDFLAYYNEIDDEKDRIEWCRKLYDAMNAICNYFDDYYLSEIFAKYNIVNKYKLNKKSVLLDFLFPYYTRYNSFLYYLYKNFLPFIKNNISELDFKLKISEGKEKYPDKFISDKDKFPLFDFEYDKISLYSKTIFKQTKENIEYFSFVVMKYNLLTISKKTIPNHYDETIKKLNFDLQHLKTVYDLEVKNVNIQRPASVLNNNTSAPISTGNKSKTPRLGKTKKTEYFKLIKRYFEYAVGFDCIPTQKQLATNHLSESSWSRYMNDELFLPVLLNAIEKRKKKPGIRKKLKDLYEALYDDILQRNLALQNAEEKYTGQINKKAVSVNENIENKGQNIFDDEEDNNNLNPFS